MSLLNDLGYHDVTRALFLKWYEWSWKRLENWELGEKLFRGEWLAICYTPTYMTQFCFWGFPSLIYISRSLTFTSKIPHYFSATSWEWIKLCPIFSFHIAWLCTECLKRVGSMVFLYPKPIREPFPEWIANVSECSLIKGTRMTANIVRCFPSIYSISNSPFFMQNVHLSTITQTLKEQLKYRTINSIQKPSVTKQKIPWRIQKSDEPKDLTKSAKKRRS